MTFTMLSPRAAPSCALAEASQSSNLRQRKGGSERWRHVSDHAGPALHGPSSFTAGPLRPSELAKVSSTATHPPARSVLGCPRPQQLQPLRLGFPAHCQAGDSPRTRPRSYTTCSLRVLWGTAAGCQEGWTQNEGSDGPRRRGGEQPVGIPSSSACSEEPLPVTPQEK